MLCDPDSLLSPEVRRAKEGQLPTAEVMALLTALLQEDRTAQGKLDEALTRLEGELDEIAARLLRAEAYEKAKVALVAGEAQEKSRLRALADADAALTAARSTVPEQEELSRRITQLELLLPAYDELEAKCIALADTTGKLTRFRMLQETARSSSQRLTGELAERKAELQSLAGAEAEREKLTAARQQLTDRKNRFRSFCMGMDSLNAQCRELEEMQQTFLNADEVSSRLLQVYEGKYRAFLAEQAGLLADTLVPGQPCPVCGSAVHPAPAALSDQAPTEADVKKAKKEYEAARKATEKASLAAGKQQGKVTSAREALEQELSGLMPGVPMEQALDAALTQEHMIMEQFLTLGGRLQAEEKRIARKAELERLIPQKEAELALAERQLVEAREQLAALTAAREQLTERIEQLRQELAYPDKAAAEGECKALRGKLTLLKTALTQAEGARNQCKETLAGIQATIGQLRKQLAEGNQEDVPALQERKNLLLGEKSQVIAKQKQLHTRISTNETAARNIEKRSAQLQELDSRYSWMKSLSDTANGTLTGKGKIMLETYIQTTYFERILRRANIRLQKMSGGQYDLKRRQSPDNKSSQSGLELDIVDHINTTERSVNTLSGGEAFLASLALALGLSDEIQMSTGIRLDTLFVDEGFGSLDSEALSKAYGTLSGLTEGNRLVGIISHVAELKEWIDKQIIVTKTKTGSSTAKIVLEGN
jgi:exonuclease SbcC